MKQGKLILFALLLSLPVILFLAHHYLIHAPELSPTGFTVDENVLYMSYAQQYHDAENFSVFFSNPFDSNPDSPRIYFQPATLLLAGMTKMGLTPGFAFSLFGLIAAIGCIYIGIKLVRHLLPDNLNWKIISLLFTWGGGLIAITGLLVGLTGNMDPYDNWFDMIYLADPSRGWWGLNWGRNLFIPLEAFYHFLFLLNIFFILKKKWAAAIAFSLLLSLSHPFTGIEYLLIVLGWLTIEKLIYRNKEMPWFFLLGIFALTIAHAFYYLVYLNRFPEHRQIFEQYSVGWTYSLRIAVPAYILVAILSVYHVYQIKKGQFRMHAYQRLFLCWALISFLLSKHEWFIEPMQPIHFTRGYTWAGLFLFSLPLLSGLVNHLKTKGKQWILAAGIGIFLSDNILWTANLLNEKYNAEWEGHITPDTKEILKYFSDHGSGRDLLIGDARLVNYMVHVYAPVNAWVSHPYNTPKREERIRIMENYFITGNPPVDWNGRKILILVENKKSRVSPDASWKKLFENSSYTLFTP